MKRHLNLILANALIKNGNKGCVALTYSTLFLFDKILSENNIDYTIYLPDSHCKGKTGEESAININGKQITFKILNYYSSPNIKKNFALQIKQLLSGGKDKSIFKQSDFILDIGQGDSFADIYGQRRFDSIDLIHRVARALNKPYCILPQTIGPFSNPKVRTNAMKSMECADMVMARDKQSLDYVQQLIPQKEVKEYIDVAFFLPYTQSKFDENYTHVGLNISSLLWHGGYTKNNQFGLVCDYQKTILSIIEYFLSMPKVKLHLVGHVVVDYQHTENDYAVNTELWKSFNHPNLILAPLFMDPITAKSYISGMDFFMGARMHATIAAFSSGVPVVPMAYSRKFNGLFEDTLDYHYMADLKIQPEEEVLATIKDTFEKRKRVKEIINKRMNTIVKEREQLMYDDLRQFLKTSH